jgi:hypothetical protein
MAENIVNPKQLRKLPYFVLSICEMCKAEGKSLFNGAEPGFTYVAVTVGEKCYCSDHADKISKNWAEACFEPIPPVLKEETFDQPARMEIPDGLTCKLCGKNAMFRSTGKLGLKEVAYFCPGCRAGFVEASGFHRRL